MNVLYAGFNNPVSVSASGISSDKVHLSMKGGNLTAQGKGKYIARPAAVGQDVTFTVTGKVNGKQTTMGSYTFKVRRLPDPTAYLALGDTRFKGGRLTKGAILNAGGLNAAIDDGLLDIEFRVQSFECVFAGRMGELRVERSAGSRFSENQRELMRQLRNGSRFYIRGVVATGPDGTTRTLPQALEVIIN